MGVLTGQPLEPVRPMSHGAARTPFLIACSELTASTAPPLKGLEQQGSREPRRHEMIPLGSNMSLDQVQVHQEGGHVNTCSPGSDSLDKALSGILDGYKCPRPIQAIGWTCSRN